MARKPFFSIIIPTKSRSHIIGNAIQSILNQSFEDYEIVVVDNDDTEATHQVIEQFDDGRIRYFQTGGLSMADNWDFARQQVQGEYLTVLPDRQVLYTRALGRLYDILDHTNAPILSWMIDSINNTDPQNCVYSALYTTATKEVQTLNSLERLQTFVQEGYYAVIFTIPSGLRSCLHHSVVDKIVAGPARRLCLPSAPDFTMAFLQMAYYDEYRHLDEALAASAWGDSNGYQFMMKRRSHVKRFMTDVGSYVALKYLPIKTTQLATNIAFSDFLYMQDLVGLNLKQATFDKVAYFKLCYKEIVERTTQGVDMEEEAQLWTEALRQESDDVQHCVEESVKPLRQTLNHYQRTKLMKLLQYQALRPYRKIKHLMNLRSNSSISPLFPDLISAISWEAEQPHNNPPQ